MDPHLHPDCQIDNTVENLTQYLPFGHIELVLFLRLSRHQKCVDFINSYNNCDKMMLN